jgi:transposase
MLSRYQGDRGRHATIGGERKATDRLLDRLDGIRATCPPDSRHRGKERLGSISKQGDRYLRRLLVIGATAVIRQARTHPDKHPWLIQLLARRPAKVVAVALANKTARIAWAVLARGGTYRAPVLAARVQMCCR